MRKTVHGKPLLAGLSLAALLACGEATPPGQENQDPFGVPPELAPVALGDVINLLVAQLSQTTTAPVAGVGPGVEEGPNFPVIDAAGAGDSEVDPEEVRGLTEMLAASSGNMRDLALADAQALGISAIGELTTLAIDTQAAFDTRAAAMEVLAGLDDVRAEITLLELLRTLTEPGLRAHAAWRLSEGKQDCVVPCLVLRMKYEGDLPVLQWIATALAKHRNYSGVEKLLNWAEDPRNAAGSESARSTADALALEIEFESALALVQAWQGGDPEQLLPQHVPSDGYMLACYLWMQRLSDYQLRGVDDSRYVLSRLDASAAGLMGPALFDENVYVRTHVAQALERMGPRAEVAVSALVRALADDRIGARAAKALGAIGATQAEEVLLTLTSEGVQVGLRLAAVRALTQMVGMTTEATAQRLGSLFQAAPSADIWQSAGEGLLALDAEVAVVHSLSSCLAGKSPLGPVEPRTTHVAIRAWFQRRADRGDAQAATAIASWDALAIDSPYFAPSKEDVVAMQTGRQKLALEFVPGP